MENEEKNLSKEEILAKSREENKKGDERDKQITARANSLGYNIGYLIAIIIAIISLVCTGNFPLEILALTAGMTAVKELVIGIKMPDNRKFYLSVGIAEGAIAVAAFVLWILKLCGVM